MIRTQPIWESPLALCQKIENPYFSSEKAKNGEHGQQLRPYVFFLPTRLLNTDYLISGICSNKKASGKDVRDITICKTAETVSCRTLWLLTKSGEGKIGSTRTGWGSIYQQRKHLLVLIGYGVRQLFFDVDQAQLCGWKWAWRWIKWLVFPAPQIPSDMTVTVVNVTIKLVRRLFRGTRALHNFLIWTQELLNR